MTVRPLAPPGSAQIALVYIQGLIPPTDLERLALVPLVQGGITDAPSALAQSGRFAAPSLRVLDDARALLEGLLTGQVAIHIDGHPGVLLLGVGEQESIPGSFGLNAGENISLIARKAASHDLRIQRLGNGSTTIIYLETCAAPELVRSVKDWYSGPEKSPSELPRWRAFIDVFRIHPVMTATSPVALHRALGQGYVAILTQTQPTPVLAPVTLDILLSGPRDVTLPLAVQRLVFVQRLTAAFIGLTLGSVLIAMTAYHHSLMPGPFLVAMAATRQNMPFPTVMEMFLVSVLGDAADAAATRIGGQRTSFLAWIGIVVAVMAAMQVGVLGAVSGAAAIAASVIRETLPNAALARIIRSWRYPFMLAAAGLGIYGFSLMIFAALIYLGEERAFGQLIRLKPKEVGS